MRAGERGDGQQAEREPRGEERAEHDQRRCAERRAARYADQARIGERIAKERLHRGAGRAEARADEEREHDARRADVDEHRARLAQRRVARELRIGGGERAEQLRGREPVRADAECGDRRGGERGDQRGERPSRASPAQCGEGARRAGRTALGGYRAGRMAAGGEAHRVKSNGRGGALEAYARRPACGARAAATVAAPRAKRHASRAAQAAQARQARRARVAVRSGVRTIAHARGATRSRAARPGARPAKRRRSRPFMRAHCSGAAATR
ncbi:Uncharacterised protein [Burkholderia pseudomallei]|nr:Uncharacterised protein [Burkholderia pseudomallei]